MDTRAFAYFEAVCRCGGYAAAARELGVSKQALASGLDRLSGAYGVPLLEAGPAGTVPTNYGRIFLRCCRDVIARLNKLGRELETERAHASNIVRVGFVGGSLTYFGEERFGDGCGGRVAAEVHAVGDYEEAGLARALLADEVDFAVLRRPPRTGVMAVPVVRDTMFFWVGRSNPLARKALLTPADLTGHTLAVLRFEDEDRAAFIEMMRASAQGARVVFFDEMIDVFEEALSGRALGFTTRQHVERIPVPSLVAIPYSELRLSYFLCYRAERAVSASDAAFLEFMRAGARFYW